MSSFPEGLDVKGLPCAQEAIAHAVASFPSESVGLIVVKRGKPIYVPCQNVEPEPGAAFQMGDTDWAMAERMGEVIALVHSHPQAGSQPSEADLVMCERSDVPWYIIAVHQNAGESAPAAVDISLTKPSGYKAPLVGRSFHHGVLDCFTIVKDYYSEVLNIELPDFDRSDEWWMRGENLYLKNFASAGFVEVSELELHDVILMQIKSPQDPNHAAVYIGNTQILHHMYNRLSSRDVYGGGLREATRMILRHRSMMK